MLGNSNTFMENESDAEELILQNDKKAVFGTSLNFMAKPHIQTFIMKVRM